MPPFVITVVELRVMIPAAPWPAPKVATLAVFGQRMSAPELAQFKVLVSQLPAPSEPVVLWSGSQVKDCAWAGTPASKANVPTKITARERVRCIRQDHSGVFVMLLGRRDTCCAIFMDFAGYGFRCRLMTTVF